ncbi:conserved hypothetical protein [Methanocella paludicola SANAE]|uniref:UPF0235 protein MCP_0111 n=1 Tax=Methanocella paludicola (strain DSM 17711 / JCM 13418 / NBRC 101707 / SANAE) TaxID=304371 RepID=D1YUR1_METPS|nr:DUF167 domain-containing protein [Methanocella paludicola]BAI60183.1 conserved hypothetical protein [Methanocella paludicola SANAE]
MAFQDAVRASSDGVLIDFEVSPGAKETRVPSGYNEWRRRIEARLKAPPERGRANEELIGELSALLGIPESRIEITSGARDSRKSVKVLGASREEVLRRLGGALQ